MKYIIYGINRVAKDFLYIFDDLDILYVTDDEAVVDCASDDFVGYGIKKLEEALADRTHDGIIICDFRSTDKECKERKLQEGGLVRGKDYFYEEDFFWKLDGFRIPSNRKLAVWGTGEIAERLSKWNKDYKIQQYIDNYKRSDFFDDVPVTSPEQIKDWSEYFVVIAVGKNAEIKRQLCTLGMVPGEDFIDYQSIMGLPSRMLRQTIFDRACYDLDCRTMLNHLEILRGGDTRCCCTTFVSQNLDNVLEKNVHELWHSNLHKIMCLSTENKTYSFCDKNMCPLFLSGKKQKEWRSEKADVQSYRQMSSYPEVLALGHDHSCNLSCRTCRKEVCFAQGEELEQINQITEKIKAEYLQRCRFLILAGDGEVFASSMYRSLYESEQCNPEYIRLLSNGTLFTPKNWERFRKGKTGRIMLTVSVDAATKQTYERIRRNGSFDALRENMEFASRLREKKILSYFRLNFVVQRENYREMVPFVQWGERLGVDEIFFTKILNWGTYTAEEFLEISMMEPDGITPKQELKEVLSHPVMNSRIVDLGTIQYSHKVDQIDIVENYYMWELEKRGGPLFTKRI